MIRDLIAEVGWLRLIAESAFFLALLLIVGAFVYVIGQSQIP